jgi:hypothetical protein
MFLNEICRIRKLELKKSTAELNEAINSIVSILNKHGSGKLIFGIGQKVMF